MFVLIELSQINEATFSVTPLKVVYDLKQVA